MCEEVTYGEFKSHTKDFLKQLITKPSQAKVDDFLLNCLREKGMSQSDFVKALLSSGVIERKEKVDDGLGENGSGKPTFSIAYKVPGYRFEHKLKKLHISLFEKNVPDGELLEATACAGDGAGQFVQPFAPVQRRTIYMTEEQFNSLMSTLDEATTTMNAGNYQYDVPFPVDSDDPTLKHNKGKKHGTAENAIGMDRLTEGGGYDMSTPEGRRGAENWMRQVISQSNTPENAAQEWAEEHGLYGDENIISAFVAGVEYGRENV